MMLNRAEAMFVRIRSILLDNPIARITSSEGDNLCKQLRLYQADVSCNSILCFLLHGVQLSTILPVM